jgi:predicted double-glycine peptidase
VKRIGTRVLLISLAAMLLAACETMPPQPGNEFVLAHNGFPMRRSVVTYRDQRFRSVVRQRYDFSCGAAALATLLRFYYDDPVDELDVIVEMLEGGDADRIRTEGFSLLDMKYFAEKRGYETRGFRIGPEVLERLAIPAVTLIDTRGYKHFVVIKAAENGMVYVADPARGQRRMSKRDFLDEWQNVVFFVAAKRDDTGPAALEFLDVNAAPEDVIRWIEHQGLRHLTFDPHEF